MTSPITAERLAELTRIADEGGRFAVGTPSGWYEELGHLLMKFPGRHAAFISTFNPELVKSLLALAGQALAAEPAGMATTTISPSDPLVTIAGIRHFGLAPDGSDLRDLEAAFGRLLALARVPVPSSDGREETIEECAKVADGLLPIIDNVDIQYIPARKYASDAVKDIADAIRALKRPANKDEAR